MTLWMMTEHGPEETTSETADPGVAEEPPDGLEETTRPLA
jgi:hypothetical protein